MPEGDLETWTIRTRAAAFACVASAVFASGAAAEPAAASGLTATTAVAAEPAEVSRRTNNDAPSSSSAASFGIVPNAATTKPDVAPFDGASRRATATITSTTSELLTAAARDLIKPLLGEFGAAVIGFGAGAACAGAFLGWRASSKSEKNARAASREALADLSALDESEIQDLIGDLPAWLAFRDVERGGWVNKVLSAAWPYLDVAASDVICAALDPILAATRPSFLTALRFETFSFGSVPAKIEGVKVYDTADDGAVEMDLSVFWRGDPDVVLGIRAAQDALSVPVSLTEFQCAFTLRLIFAPLMGVFPCFGALTIALVDEPRLDFDLRVVGGDVTLVPGLKESLRTYIKALVASWMVWPRCITVAIPGTGYELPSDDGPAEPRFPTGLLHVQVVGHDERAARHGEVGLLVRSASETSDLRYGARGASAAETRVAALPGGGVLSSREVTLPVEDLGTQLLCVRWYSAPVDAFDGARTEREDPRGEEDASSDGGERSRAATAERLTGEASIVLEDLMRQAPEARETGGEGSREDVASSASLDVTGQWGPVPVVAELEAPAGADIARVRGDARGGVRGFARRAARRAGGLFGKTAGGVAAGYRAARSDGLRLAPIRDAAVDGWRARGEASRGEASAGPPALAAGLAGAADGDAFALDEPDPGAGAVHLRVRYQPLDAAAARTRETAKEVRDADARRARETRRIERTERTERTDSPGAPGAADEKAGPEPKPREASRARGAEALERPRRLETSASARAGAASSNGGGGGDDAAATPSRPPAVVETRGAAAAVPPARETEKTEKDASRVVSRDSKRRDSDAAVANAAAALVTSPAADADPRLAPLVAAARSAAAAVQEARARHAAAEAASGGFGKGFGPGSEKREALEAAMARADALVARAATAVAESARAAEADQELAELKRALRAKETSEDDAGGGANGKGDAASR